MAVLAGLSPSESVRCASKTPGCLEEIPFVWKSFHELNYTTAYAEDIASYSTFHNNYAGFLAQPTDYYLRPFTVALEKEIGPGSNPPGRKHICMGNQFYIDYLQKFALDFVRSTSASQPFFGLFWSNSFSHDSASIPREVDRKVAQFLRDLTGLDDKTIIIFFSDHGIRYGPTRFTQSGFYEERLPFLWIYLPPKFRQAHPKLAENLRDNKNKLTTPYDLHMTLKHILSLSGEQKSLTCSNNCQSLLNTIPSSRSCQSVNIDPYWCTCPHGTFEEIDDSQLAINYAMDLVNAAAEQYFMCAKLNLKSVRNLRAATMENSTYFLLQWDTLPGTGIFEAMLKFENGTFEPVAEFSRLSWYELESWCIDTSKFGWDVKKACYCTFFQKSTISYIIYVTSALIAVALAISYVIYLRFRRDYKNINNKNLSDVDEL